MKYIDVVVQTLCVAAGVVMMGIAWTNQQQHWAASILFAQLYLAPWQLLSSVVSVVRGSKAQRLKEMHLVLSAVYIVTLAVFPLEGVPLLLYWTIPAWTLAAYYYIITWKIALQKNHTGPFLPHLSF